MRTSLALGLLFLLGAAVPACGSSGGSESTGGASSGGAGGASAGTGGSSAGTGGGDASTDAPGPDPNGCQKAGGQCGCAGGCNPGYHPATGALLWQCPQPCDNCGACSEQCCLPDDAGNSEPCGPGGACVAPGASCPTGTTMTQMGCDLDAQLGSCCIVSDAG